MPKPYPMRLSDEFVEGLVRIWFQRVLDHIHDLVSMLPSMPQMGSVDVRESLRRRYGDNLRKLNVSTFVIVYRFDGAVIDVLAIEYGPAVN